MIRYRENDFSDQRSRSLPRIMTCPFCGSEPEVMGSGENQRGLMIHCIGKDCPNPSVSYYEHAAAISVWNRRAGS